MNRNVRLLSGILLFLTMAACSAAQEPVAMNTPQETVYGSFEEILMERVTPYPGVKPLDYTDVPIDVPYEFGNIDCYAYEDLNGDGQDELLLGSANDKGGQITQAFSLVDGTIYQLWGWDDAHKFFLCRDGSILYRWGEAMRTNAYGRFRQDGLTLVLEEAFFFERDRDGAPAWFSSRETLDFPEQGLPRNEMRAYQVLDTDTYDAEMQARRSYTVSMTTLQQWCDDRGLAVMDPWSCSPAEGILLPYTSYGEMLDTWKQAEAEQWPYETVLGYPYGYPGLWYYEGHYDALYAMLDVDGDGVEELLIRGSSPPGTGNENGLRALYTMRDGHVLQLFLIWSDREWWQLCEGGVLKHSGWSGASSGECGFCKQAENGSLEDLGVVSYKDMEYFDGQWYPPETAVKITEAEYNAFCSQHRVLEESELPEYTRLIEVINEEKLS